MAVNYFHHASDAPIMEPFNALLTSNAPNATDFIESTTGTIANTITSQSEFLNSSAVSLHGLWNMSKTQALRKQLEGEKKVEATKFKYADKVMSLTEEDRYIWRDLYRDIEHDYIGLHLKNITQYPDLKHGNDLSDFYAGRLSARVKLQYKPHMRTLPYRINPFNLGCLISSAVELENAMDLDVANAMMRGYVMSSELEYSRFKRAQANYFSLVKQGHDIHDNITNRYSNLEANLNPHVEGAIDALYNDNAASVAKKQGRFNQVLDGLGSIASNIDIPNILAPFTHSGVNVNNVVDLEQQFDGKPQSNVDVNSMDY